MRDATGTNEFTYVLDVAHVRGDKGVWEGHEPFRETLGGNPARIITFKDMASEICEELGTTLAATEARRMLQMFRATRIGIE